VWELFKEGFAESAGWASGVAAIMLLYAILIDVRDLTVESLSPKQRRFRQKVRKELRRIADDEAAKAK